MEDYYLKAKISIICASIGLAVGLLTKNTKLGHALIITATAYQLGNLAGDLYILGKKKTENKTI